MYLETADNENFSDIEKRVTYIGRHSQGFRRFGEPMNMNKTTFYSI